MHVVLCFQMCVYLVPCQQLQQGLNASRRDHLLQFRAGRMNREGKMIVPDKRKGMVTMDDVCPVFFLTSHASPFLALFVSVVPLCVPLCVYVCVRVYVSE